jgi:hypothetical protein
VLIALEKNWDRLGLVAASLSAAVPSRSLL